jgi:integrase
MGIYKVGQKWYIDLYVDGRRIRKAVGSKKDAENALAATKADVLRGEFRFKSKIRKSFEDFSEEYLEYAKANKRSWTRDEIILEHLKGHFKDRILSRISAKDVEDYKQKRLEKVKPPTINRELAILKHMFNLAIRWKYVDGNPVKEVEFFQERELATKTLKKDEAQRLIEASNGNLKPLIIMALNTGMRRGELLKLKWGDLDFDNHFICIKETKTAKVRKVPMNLMVERTLKGIERKCDHVFQSPKTKKRQRHIRTGWHNACDRAGIHDFRFHDLRHTAATWMVAAGIDLVTVKEILGHANIKTTMRYAHPTPENKRKAVNSLAAILGEKVVTIRSYKEDSQVETSLLSDN